MTREEIIENLLVLREWLIKGFGKEMPKEYLDTLAQAHDMLSVSFPSNLEEAAEVVKQEYVYNEGGPFPHTTGISFFNGFKAGAEWMAEQGVNVEGVFKAGDPGYPDIRMGEQYSIEHILRKPGGIEPGDKVVVQIRKK